MSVKQYKEFVNEAKSVSKSVLTDIVDKFTPKGMWANGSKLDVITSYLESVLGKDCEVCINTGYHDFVCKGKIKDVNRDVDGLMPFSKHPIREEDATTLFYGNDKIHHGNYLPFQADTDTFRVKDAYKKGSVVYIDLEEFYENFM